MAWWPAACTQHHTARGLTTLPLYQPSNRAAVANGTKTAKAQPQMLEFPAGPLMRLHSQGLIQGGHLWDGASVGTPSDPAPPPDRPKQAHDLALWQSPYSAARPRSAGRGARRIGCWARSASTASTRWTASTRATCHAARISCGQGGGLFDRVQQTLHSGIIIAYAVV